MNPANLNLIEPLSCARIAEAGPQCPERSATGARTRENVERYGLLHVSLACKDVLHGLGPELFAVSCADAIGVQGPRYRVAADA